MHQILFRLRLRLVDPAGELIALTLTTWMDLRGLLLRGRAGEGKRGKRKKRKRGRSRVLTPILLSNLTTG